jgi:hypothetical protein
MAVGRNWASSPGPKPGSTRAISQHKAISEGYEAAPSERTTNLNQRGGKTGCVHAPGYTTKGHRE